MMTRKNILLSKTFWFNLLSLVGVVVLEVSNWEFIPPEWKLKLVGFLALINMILRAVTNQGVKL